jgi:uncharacterized phage infection (PIP) family protein YhgE
MSEFDSKLSFYIPMVFPKHANVDFVREAFHDAHIGEVVRVDFERSSQNHYKAYVYFNWIENDMTYGIQSQLSNYNQTYFTFNNRIRNGYWIVKKNKKEEIEAKNKSILVSCYESIVSDQKKSIRGKNKVIASLKNKLDEKNRDSHELHENHCKLRELFCEKEVELYNANCYIDFKESVLSDYQKKLAECEKKLAECEQALTETESKFGKYKRKTKRKLENYENRIDEMIQENETETEFFENKICELQCRVDQLETHFEEQEELADDEDEDDTEEEEEEEYDEDEEQEEEEQAEHDDEEEQEEEEQAEHDDEEEQEQAEQDDEEEQEEAEQEEEQEQAEQDDEEEQDQTEVKEVVDETVDDEQADKEERIVKEDALSVILSAYDEEEDEDDDFIVL